MNKLFLFLFLFFMSCNNISSKKDTSQDALQEDILQEDILQEDIPQQKEVKEYNCIIPEKILEYISHNSEDFILIDLDEETLSPVEGFVQEGGCPTACFGDFNQNGKEDFAIILKYTKFKEPGGDPNYNFPFLVIFNDYKEQINPTIIYKTGEYYENEDIITVIYDQFDGKLSSFIKKDTIGNKDVVAIRIPEKSTFYVYWDVQTSQYGYLNVLDDNLYERILGTNNVSEE